MMDFQFNIYDVKGMIKMDFIFIIVPCHKIVPFQESELSLNHSYYDDPINNERTSDLKVGMLIILPLK